MVKRRWCGEGVFRAAVIAGAAGKATEERRKRRTPNGRLVSAQVARRSLSVAVVVATSDFVALLQAGANDTPNQ